MKNSRLLWGFVATLIIAGFLRFFVIDVISISNDLLQPHFYPGDFLLVSKISKADEGQWVLLKNYPQKSVYSIRLLVRPESDQGWIVVEPKADGGEEKAFVSHQQILGRAVLILWSLPCKPSSVAEGTCPDKTNRFMKSI
jgi:signal peptidase I